MTLHFDTAIEYERERGFEVAQSAARRGDLVVMPTDTVYGLGCDAFSVSGVAKLLEAKGRGRDFAVPVLVGSPSTVSGLPTSTGTGMSRPRPLASRSLATPRGLNASQPRP